MKEVLSLFTFGIGALCFVVFVTVFKPDAVRTVTGPTKSLMIANWKLRLHTLAFRTCLPRSPKLLSGCGK
jgi:hypothetical protein